MDWIVITDSRIRSNKFEICYNEFEMNLNGLLYCTEKIVNTRTLDQLELTPDKNDKKQQW